MGNVLPEGLAGRRFEAVPEIVGAPTGKINYGIMVISKIVQQSSD